MGYRADQVAGLVRQEIMEIIQRDLKDPRIGFVSITSIRMSPDFRSARVFISVLGDEEAQKASLKGLISAKGLIRHELGKRLQNLKSAPDIHFELDPSIEYSVHISKRLREVLPPGQPVAPANTDHGSSDAEGSEVDTQEEPPSAT